jgi:biotin transport system substrate-specific component
MTLQSLGVLLCGFACTPRQALAALGAYLALGAAGLPVFTPGSAGLWGGTGGYLLGFLVGAWLVALCKGDTAAGTCRLFLAGAAGTIAILACGVLWRVVLFQGDAGFALATGVTPFVWKAVVQLGVAVSIVRSLRGRRPTGSRLLDRA